MSFKVFTRTWWKNNSDWPDGLEPCPGRRHTLQKRVATYSEAIKICQAWNAAHKPGRLSRKAEFEEN